MNSNAAKPARIGAKDLINTGIFTVLYAVIGFAVAMLGFIPVFIPLLAVLCPLLGGIPFMLFLTKVKNFGMITIMGTLLGLIMLFGGMGVWALPTGVVFGLLADLTARSGGYASAQKSVLAHGVFSLWLMGNFLPICLNPAGYAANLIAGGYGAEYADALIRLMPPWLLPVLAVACFGSGVLGGLLGRAVLKKHFIRAGIA